MIFQTTLCTFIIFAIQATASFTGCPPDGPLLPRPRGLQDSSILRNVTGEFEDSLNQALNGTIQAGWAVENASFSLGLVSVDNTDRRPIWEFHHRGSANANGTDEVDGDTQYLIGSISKLVTELLVLRTGIDVDTPITQYLPQLANESSIIPWENITLASLSDHLSGIPPNYGFSEWFILQPFLEQLGFPSLSEDDFTECGVAGLNGACSEDQILEGMLSAHPITAPFQRPVYSQLSYTLLSYVLSASYNKTYAELLDEYVIQPFNLTNTGVSPGNTSLAVIPPMENSWGSDYGDNAPGGGLYSSLNDMNTIVQAILDGTALNTKTNVKEWLKPHSATSSPFTLVGEAWEIFRSTNLTPAHPHTIDIYAKNGGAYGYIAQMAVIDQYGVGLVLLTAGPPEVYRILYDAILSAFLPVVEEETRLQAEKYTGNFSSADGLVEFATSIDDGPGVVLDGLSRNGSNILGALGQLFTQALPQFGNLSTDFRIFPADYAQTDTVRRNGSEVEVVKEDWRINLDFQPNTKDSSGSELPGQGALKELCVAWQTADWFYYGGEAIDRIVFVKDLATDEVLAVEVPFLRAELSRDVE